MTTVLVTGANGFLGRYVVRQLSQVGTRVVAMDMRIPEGALLEPGVEYVQCDIRDLRRVLRICSEQGVERVIHLASLLAPASQADPYTSTEVNVLGTQNVFEAAVQLGFANVTWATSQAVYGHVTTGGATLTEHTPHQPDNAYGWAKSYSEGLSRQYRARYGINLIGLRIAMLYGSGKERGEGKFTEHLFDRPALGLDSVVPFGDDTFCWQYVADVADAFATCVRLDSAADPVYNIPGRRATIAEAADIVASLVPGVTVGREPGLLGFPYDFAEDAFMELVGSDYRMTPLRDGIAETLRTIAAAHAARTEGVRS